MIDKHAANEWNDNYKKYCPKYIWYTEMYSMEESGGRRVQAAVEGEIQRGEDNGEQM